MKTQAANCECLGTLAVLDIARCDREIAEIKARDNGDCVKPQAAYCERLGALAVIDIARCDREIAEIKARDNSATPAYLSALGIADWEREKALILREISPPASGEGRWF